MPNLEQHAVAEWLTALNPTAASAWPPPFRMVETAADNLQRLRALGSRLDQFAPGELTILPGALSQPPLRDDLRNVIAQLGAARLLRLLHWLAESDIPNCPAAIAALVDGHDATGAALRAAIAAVTRPALLRRIFAAERIAALDAASAGAG
jgi:hypothetical protein